MSCFGLGKKNKDANSEEEIVNLPVFNYSQNARYLYDIQLRAGRHDIFIGIGKHRIAGHSAVMAQGSDYFRGLFRWEESHGKPVICSTFELENPWTFYPYKERYGSMFDSELPIQVLSGLYLNRRERTEWFNTLGERHSDKLLAMVEYFGVNGLSECIYPKNMNSIHIGEVMLNWLSFKGLKMTLSMKLAEDYLAKNLLTQVGWS